jgi:hypothetical protein
MRRETSRKNLRPKCKGRGNKTIGFGRDHRHPHRAGRLKKDFWTGYRHLHHDGEEWRFHSCDSKQSDIIGQDVHTHIMTALKEEGFHFFRFISDTRHPYRSSGHGYSYRVRTSNMGVSFHYSTWHSALQRPRIPCPYQDGENGGFISFGCGIWAFLNRARHSIHFLIHQLD